MSRLVQKRVLKLFDRDYNYQNWTWLLDPVKPEVPPPIPRSVVSAEEEAAADPPVEGRWKSCQKMSLWAYVAPPEVTKLRGEVEEEGSSKSPRASARVRVSNDFDFVCLNFIKCCTPLDTGLLIVHI